MKVEEIVEEYRNLSADDVLIDALAAEINPKEASKLLQLLADKLPLADYGLTHVKRIRRINTTTQILLCPKTHAFLINDEVSVFSASIVPVQVMKYAAKCRQEFEQWNKYWPVNFRPSDLERERLFDDDDLEIKRIAEVFKLVDHDADLMKPFNGGVLPIGSLLLNPESNKVVITSRAAFDNLALLHGDDVVKGHSLYTPTMLCIEGCSAMVRGEIPVLSAGMLFDEHYLCTGLDIYLSTEPDAMSSMALVHSRIRRVYYKNSDPVGGALGTRSRIHCLRSLNHKYRVFKCTDDKTII